MATATPSPLAVDVHPGAVVTSIAPAAGSRVASGAAARTVVVLAGLALASLGPAAGCAGAGRDLGESCDTSSECGTGLQCLAQICVPRCRGHVDCGDGAVCSDGECQAVVSDVGDPCFSELQCGAGQTCRLASVLGIAPGTCEPEVAGALEGETCAADDECRTGGCALGRCVALCRAGDDCRRGWTCAAVPLPARSASVVNACLPGNATIAFEVPVPAPDPAAPDIVPEILIPVPSTARSMVLVFEAPSPTLTIGAGMLRNPRNQIVYRLPDLEEAYYVNQVRHAPRPGISVLQVPSSTAAPLIAGIYAVTVRTYRDTPLQPSTSRARLRVVEKLGSAARLDVHFYFRDLTDHPCAAAIGATLSAATARALPGFQQDYLGELEQIFAAANIALGEVTYDDLDAMPGLGRRPEFDILETAQAPELFALPDQAHGISVFFVRSLEPAGQQLLTGGTPGAPLPGTGASGLAIAVDTLCYRSWTQLARQTAHGLARHMGLFRNREPDDIATHVDPIDDSDDGLDNLMHWSEFGGTDLSLGQREILRASPVLR